MEEINNIGYIYKITNLFNGKIYIGQTSQTINQRWKEHLKDSKNPKYPLHKAIHKYGIENFKIEEIEACEIENLNEREIYWISFYNSYKGSNGYNATLGGEGVRTLNLDANEVISKYEELRTLEKTSKYFNCCKESILSILIKNNVDIRSSVDIAKEKGFTTYALDENKNITKKFSTLYEAGEWVFNNLKHNAKDIHSCKKSIIKAVLQARKAYGYYWKNDNYSEDYIEEWRKKQIDSINKEKLKNSTLDGGYKSNRDICPICGKNTKDINSNCCKDCYSTLSSKKYREEFEEKISKKELMQLVREKSFTEIAKIYNVSDKTIIRWCQKYLIPCRREDIIKILDENWEKECNLSEEEYELKYCKKKEKLKLNESQVIETYKNLKSIRGTAKEFNVDGTTIKRILEKHNVELFNSNKVISESLGKVFR